jgi:alpha-glucosidase
MIDFASEQKIPYLLIDADWYGKEFKQDSNPFSGGKAADVKKAIEYGKGKNVGLILYLNDVAGRRYGIEKITKAYADWGAKGIKYGFMRIGNPRAKVNWTHKVAKLCAENRLMINFHDGPIPPTGEEAYLPNFCTREFCHAQSDAHRVFSPGSFIRMMHVNTLAGPIDQDNGLFDLDKPTVRPRIYRNVPSTIVSEAARTLIPYSGIVVLPDAADSYRKHPKLFRFIALQQQPWHQSKTLTSDIQHWISVMRESHGVYLVGSVTDEDAREIKIKLDFLPKGKKYHATIFSDAPDADYETNRMAYLIDEQNVTSSDTIIAHMACGGGHCMILEPIN